MNRTLPAKLALIALLVPAVAFAKSSDRSQEMTIDSDSNDCVINGDNGKCRFSGNAVIHQGTLEIHAQTADIFQTNGETDRVVLNGKQATIKQQMDDGSWMNGRADNIEYKLAEDIVILTGNYFLESAKGTNTGQRMVYNTKNGTIQSGGDGTRVHTVIKPKNQAATSTQPASAQEQN
jgi:lipopolysaccharide export system protein LptA